IGEPIKMDERIALEIGGVVDTRSSGEQLWAAHGIELIAKNLVRCAVRRGTGIADCDVGLASIELHDSVDTNDRQRDICVRIAPHAERRDQPTAGESAGGRNTKRPRLRLPGEGSQSRCEYIEALPNCRK